MAKLTEMQIKFCEAYQGAAAGNASEAYRMAGYTGNESTVRSGAARLLRNINIHEHLRAMAESVSGPDSPVADRTERLKYYTSIMRGVDPYEKFKGVIEINHRTKAAELLGKVCGDFVERVALSMSEEVTDDEERRQIIDALHGRRPKDRTEES